MSRMIDLIREAAAPASIMRAAARGSLSLPAAEMLEILVFLTGQPTFGPQAEATLTAWDERSLAEVAGDPNAPPAVLDYLTASPTLCPAVLLGLLKNPSLSEATKSALAVSNRDVSDAERGEAMLAPPESGAAPESYAPPESGAAPVQHSPDVIEVSAYISDHAEEIQAAESQPFSLFNWTPEEQAEVTSARSQPQAGAVPSSTAPKATAVAAKPEPERTSTIQKIARLSVGERVQLALKGNKDERFVLIRDGVKVVCNAVIDSPKVTDAEAEMFASMKNVNESVLRAIVTKRKFMKNYAIIRTLTANPRCPIEVAVPLLSHLLTLDLKNLSVNKNVSETVRKLALKIFRDRLLRHS